MESLSFLIFSFKHPNISFDIMVLKGINDFSERAIYSKPGTFNLYLNHYQGRVYMYLYFIIKTV